MTFNDTEEGQERKAKRQITEFVQEEKMCTFHIRSKTVDTLTTKLDE